MPGEAIALCVVLGQVEKRRRTLYITVYYYYYRNKVDIPNKLHMVSSATLPLKCPNAMPKVFLTV